jgi:hypothetical protein
MRGVTGDDGLEIYELDGWVGSPVGRRLGSELTESGGGGGKRDKDEGGCVLRIIQ